MPRQGDTESWRQWGGRIVPVPVAVGLAGFIREMGPV